MDKNKDGVVTLEEFVFACQEVCIVLDVKYLFYMQYYSNICVWSVDSINTVHAFTYVESHVQNSTH